MFNQSDKIVTEFQTRRNIWHFQEEIFLKVQRQLQQQQQLDRQRVVAVVGQRHAGDGRRAGGLGACHAAGGTRSVLRRREGAGRGRKRSAGQAVGTLGREALLRVRNGLVCDRLRHLKLIGRE